MENHLTVASGLCVLNQACADVNFVGVVCERRPPLIALVSDAATDLHLEGKDGSLGRSRGIFGQRLADLQRAGLPLGIEGHILGNREGSPRRVGGSVAVCRGVPAVKDIVILLENRVILKNRHRAAGCIGAVGIGQRGLGVGVAVSVIGHGMRFGVGKDMGMRLGGHRAGHRCAILIRIDRAEQITVCILFVDGVGRSQLDVFNDGGLTGLHRDNAPGGRGLFRITDKILTGIGLSGNGDRERKRGVIGSQTLCQSLGDRKIAGGQLVMVGDDNIFVRHSAGDRVKRCGQGLIPRRNLLQLDITDQNRNAVVGVMLLLQLALFDFDAYLGSRRILAHTSHRLGGTVLILYRQGVGGQVADQNHLGGGQILHAFLKVEILVGSAAHGKRFQELPFRQFVAQERPRIGAAGIAEIAFLALFGGGRCGDAIAPFGHQNRTGAIGHIGVTDTHTARHNVDIGGIHKVTVIGNRTPLIVNLIEDNSNRAARKGQHRHPKILLAVLLVKIFIKHRGRGVGRILLTSIGIGLNADIVLKGHAVGRDVS